MDDFKRLVIKRSGEDLNPQAIDENNSFERFLSTLSEKEREGDFFELSVDKQCDYIRALALFQVEAMGSLEDAALKSLIILAIRLHKNQIDEFEIGHVFKGSKEDIKEEAFSLKLKKLEHVIKSNDISEYADESDKAPKNKFDLLWNQNESVIEILYKVKDKLPKDDEERVPLITSGVLLVSELMSSCNIETMHTVLHDLINKDTSLNVSFGVESIRKEEEYNIVPTIRPRRLT